MRLIINAIMNNNWKNPKEVPEDKFENIIQNKFGIIIAVIMLFLSLRAVLWAFRVLIIMQFVKIKEELSIA